MSLVSVASDEIIFHVVSEIGVVRVLSDKSFFSRSLEYRRSQRSQWWKYFTCTLQNQRSQ